MRHLIATTILFFSTTILCGQVLDSTENVSKKYIAWYSPSTASHVYGVNFNLFPKFPEDTSLVKFTGYPKINGLELNLNPMGLFTPFVMAVHSVGPDTHEPLLETIDSLRFGESKKINGVQLGLLNMEPSVINGLDINLTGSFESKTNGVTVSLVMNKHYVCNGITIAAIGNHDVNCNGVQIGLINSAKRMRGIQIGLWNRNEKRALPIINWCFKE